MPLDDKTAIEALAACVTQSRDARDRVLSVICSISCAARRVAEATGQDAGTLALDLVSWIEDGHGSVHDDNATFEPVVWQKLIAAHSG